MVKKQYHVVPNASRGGWDVKRSRAQKASIHTKTKVEAVKIGRVISQRAGSELVIYSADGHIQQKDSHRNAHCPPRYKK